MVELRRRFKPEVAALSEYLDRDLVGLWGYDAGAELWQRVDAAPRASLRSHRRGSNDQGESPDA